MTKVKKLLTLEQLVQFCQNNKFYTFNSNDTGYTLSVQVPGSMNFSKKDSNTLLYTEVKVCHTELNRNGSYISEENMIKAMPTLKNQPLLASIIEVDEDGTLDFNGHDMNIIENEDGTTSVEYIERQIGSFDATEEPYLKYDKEQDKTYVIAMAAIPREYSDAAKIIERKNGTKVSCELMINKMSYNAKEKYLELEDFEFSGVCCLGEHVGEGMLGSRLDIKDFSTENNSVKFEQNDMLIEMLSKLNNTLEALNINSNSTKGGNEKEMNKFEELLVKYEKTIEDITFEYEGLSDEELEVVFAETFAEPKKKIEDDDTTPVTPTDDDDNDDSQNPAVENDEPVVENSNEPDETNSSDDEPQEQPDTNTELNSEHIEEDDDEEDDEFACGDKKKKKCSIEYGEIKKEFSVSLNAQIEALSYLVNDTYADDMTWYSVEVFDKNLVMVDMWNGRAYRQEYKSKNDTYTLKGDRVEVYATYLTADEQKAFENMKANYSEISEKLAKYEEEPEKIKILESADYSSIADKEEFAELKKQENHFDLSIDELKNKADEIILSYAKKGALTFASNEEVKPNIGMKKIPMNTKSTKRSRYGGLGKKED